MAFGIYSLPQMRKNEFPDFTIRQGMVVAVAPGNSAREMAEQVAKPLEEYIFSYKEVKKEKTFSQSRDGIVYIQVQLNDDINDKDAFWSKFKHGVATFKSQLPDNVLALQVLDDFGDTSALLIAMESDDKTYRELNEYMDRLQDRLRLIPSVGRMTVSGMQKEQISVYVDNARLTKYGLSDRMLAAKLMQKGFATSGGRLQTDVQVQPVYVARSLNAVRDVEQMVVYADLKGNIVRLKDVAKVAREYPKADSYITYNGKKCLLLSVEMKKGQDIVKMGNDVNRATEEFRSELPSDVGIYRITDQSRVVSDSVATFLRELAIAIVAVVIEVMLLLPLRVALVAASTIPITIFISLGLLYCFNFELNTVTLAVLVLTLGMIVDNSIVIIDNYLEKIGEGMSRWHASIESTTHFFKSILSATLAISITFFPFLFTTTGMIHDFLLTFPWAITAVLGVSLLVATLLVPFLQFWFIRKPMQHRQKSFSVLDLLQRHYNRLIGFCFRWPKATVAAGLATAVAGIMLIGTLPQQMMPTADRNQFAVEIYLPSGAAIERTARVADSLEQILRRDPSVVSVASFKGCSSPRFQNSYAPQIGGTNYAQFIVNTTGVDETIELLDEYTPRYHAAFLDALVRFKQLSYSEAVYPVEFRLSGNDWDSLRTDAGKLLAMMRAMPELTLAHSDNDEPLPTAMVKLKEDEAARLGVSNTTVETTLALRYGDGLPVAKVWERRLRPERGDKGRTRRQHPAARPGQRAHTGGRRARRRAAEAGGHRHAHVAGGPDGAPQRRVHHYGDGRPAPRRERHGADAAHNRAAAHAEPLGRHHGGTRRRRGRHQREDSAHTRRAGHSGRGDTLCAHSPLQEGWPVAAAVCLYAAVPVRNVARRNHPERRLRRDLLPRHSGTDGHHRAQRHHNVRLCRRAQGQRAHARARCHLPVGTPQDATHIPDVGRGVDGGDTDDTWQERALDANGHRDLLRHTDNHGVAAHGAARGILHLLPRLDQTARQSP